MKHLNVDWYGLIGWLSVWETLSEQSKLAYLRVKPSESLARDIFDEPDCQRLIDMRLLAASADGMKVRMPAEAREFSSAIRAMARHRLDDVGTERALVAYTRDHLTGAEHEALLDETNPRSRYYGSDNLLLLTRKDWLEQFLALGSAKAARRWESQRLPDRRDRSRGTRFEDGAPYFQDEALFEATKTLIEAAMTWPQPVPLTELADHVTNVDPHLLGRAIMPAVRYLLLFPRLAGEDMTPVIGIWPQIAYLLHRPAARAPKPVKPAETFHAPVLIEDMTTVLVAAAADPLRVLASGQGLYAKDLQRLVESAFALPSWLIRQAGDDDFDPREDAEASSDEARMLDAVHNCLRLKLLRSHKGQSGRNQLQITAVGRDWLGKDMRERLRLMLEPWREASGPEDPDKARRHTTHHAAMAGLEAPWLDDDEDDDDGQWLDDGPWSNGAYSPWTPSRLRWGGGSALKQVDWRAAFVDLLRDADGAFVPAEDLLAYHSRVNNPLLGRRVRGSYGPKPRVHMYGLGVGEPNETQLEKLWDALADDMIARHLVPLGALELGWLNGQLAIRLHDIGRYILGLADDFGYRAHPEGAVIIQPNFEVTLLGPAPRAEAIIGRLAQRTGSRTGTMFRITRASVLAAAGAGITADDALHDLSEVSSKPVPANVAREVRGWFDTTRHVRMRQAWLIDAGDEATATRILAAAGKQARQVTPTLVEITAAKKDHAALVRKLKAAGVFVR